MNQAQVLVINLTRVTQHPHVRHADGQLDAVQIAPRGRTNLRDGMIIDPRWLSSNPDVLRIVDPIKPAVTANPMGDA